MMATMTVDRVAHVTWTIVPGEQEQMLVEFWLDERATEPDETVGDSFFQLTIRRNARDTGDPLAYAESGDGIEISETNSILITLSAEQTMALIGCKEPRYALMRDGQTVYDGSIAFEYTVVQAGP